MEENEKKGRTNSNKLTQGNFGNPKETQESAPRKKISGQRPVRKKIGLESGKRVSQDGEESIKRGTLENTGTTSRRRTIRSAEMTSRRRNLGESTSVSGRKGSEESASVSRRRSAEESASVPRRRSAEESASVPRRRSAEESASVSRRKNAEESASEPRRRSPEKNRRRRPSGAKRPASRQQAKRRRKRMLILKISLFIILVIAAVAGAFLWKKYSPSKEKADLKKYYGIEQKGQLAIIVNNEILEPRGIVSEGKAYVQYETVRDYISNRFYWDSNENKLLYTLPKDIVSVEVGSKEYMVSNDKNNEDYVILKTEGSTAYIALDFIQQYVNIDYEVYDDPGRVSITSEWGEKLVAVAKKDAKVRYRGGVKSPILTEVEKKDEVLVLEEEENWEKVRTKDGYIGYIQKNALKNTEKKTVTRKFDEPEYTNISEDHTINLVWHNVTNREANNNVLDKIAETKGLTTIAPTWYHVKNTDGDLASISSSDYVEKARQLKVDVWATVRDFDGGINSQKETYELLSSTSKREKLINQLIADALQTNIAGINVDFEKVSEECGEHYIQFIRELSVKCRQSALVLSVDNYVPKDYNKQYNRKEQGVFADYVIIMGYDEHFGGSPEAGSVASYNFVKEGIEETLKEVPAEKVISGIPFFTRLWSEKPKTQEQLAKDKGTEAEQYATEVKSDAYGMAKAKEKVSEAGAEITWDEETQQNFATWTDGDTTYKIWLEDVKSLEPKLKLMKEYKLAGSAAWALGQETSDVWPLIQQYVN